MYLIAERLKDRCAGISEEDGFLDGHTATDFIFLIIMIPITLIRHSIDVAEEKD
jgi:hypothetical protein